MSAVVEVPRPGLEPPSAPGPVLWRALTRATFRQHRTAVIWLVAAAAAAAALLLVTGVVMRLGFHHGVGYWLQTPNGHSWHGWRQKGLALLLQALPVLAGITLGAPLLPREIENGTSGLAWTQGPSRTRWLLSQIVPLAVLLALLGAALGAEFTWWRSLFPPPRSGQSGPWNPVVFNLTPQLLALWTVLAFALGVFVGAVIRRTLAAVVVTAAGYLGILWAAATWRVSYLPWLHHRLPIHFGPHGYTVGWLPGPGPAVLSSQERLGYPDGRLLTWAQNNHVYSQAWFTSHHVVMWLTYQPDSRFDVFQLIEAAWVLAAAAILTAAAVFLTRRRSAVRS